VPRLGVIEIVISGEEEGERGNACLQDKSDCPVKLASSLRSATLKRHRDVYSRSLVKIRKEKRKVEEPAPILRSRPLAINERERPSIVFGIRIFGGRGQAPNLTRSTRSMIDDPLGGAIANSTDHSPRRRRRRRRKENHFYRCYSTSLCVTFDLYDLRRSVKYQRLPESYRKIDRAPVSATSNVAN